MAAQLIDLQTKKATIICKSTLNIGRNNFFVDLCIAEPTISRLHCRITQKADGCYLMDLNSANYTYLNNSILQPNTEYRLRDGDEIRLANVRYRFAEVL